MKRFEEMRRRLGLSMEHAARLWAEEVTSPEAFVGFVESREGAEACGRLLRVSREKVAELAREARRFLAPEPAPEPNEVCDLVWGLGAEVVAGKHDRAAAGLYCFRDSFRPRARKAMYRTIEVLSGDNREWLAGLPLVHQDGAMTFVHATLAGPERWRAPRKSSTSLVIPPRRGVRS